MTQYGVHYYVEIDLKDTVRLFEVVWRLSIKVFGLAYIRRR
jgi:hypothetical protein